MKVILSIVAIIVVFSVIFKIHDAILTLPNWVGWLPIIIIGIVVIIRNSNKEQINR